MRLIISVLLTSLPNIVFAETIWCRYLEVGCLTEAEKQEIRSSCMRQARAQYSEYLKRAFEQYKDSGLANWEAGGYRSAQEDVRVSIGLYYSLCLKGKGLKEG